MCTATLVKNGLFGLLESTEDVYAVKAIDGELKLLGWLEENNEGTTSHRVVVPIRPLPIPKSDNGFSEYDFDKVFDSVEYAQTPLRFYWESTEEVQEDIQHGCLTIIDALKYYTNPNFVIYKNNGYSCLL